MLALLCFVLAVLASPFKSKIRLEAENAALRHQVIVLRRKLPGRVRLSNSDRWFWRPSAIACYSAELGMPSIPSMLPMPKVQDQFEEDGRPRDPAHERRAARFLDEFEWYARALKEARAQGVPY